MLACAMPVGFFYLLVTYALVSLMHKGVLSTDDLSSPFLIIAQKLHLPILGIVGSVGIALSFFTCALASINAAARTLFSMSKDGHFWPQFGTVHPRNASPYKAVALVAIFSGAPSVALLLSGVSTESVIDYLSELGCTGFVISYLLVCLAAPFFLRKIDLLGSREISIAVLSLGCLLMVLGFNLFPIQPAPYCYFIFIFCGTVVVAASTAFLQPAISHSVLSESAPYTSAKVLDPSE
jgi:amino acid transporter